MLNYRVTYQYKRPQSRRTPNSPSQMSIVDVQPAQPNTSATLLHDPNDSKAANHARSVYVIFSTSSPPPPNVTSAGSPQAALRWYMASGQTVPYAVEHVRDSVTGLRSPGSPRAQQRHSGAQSRALRSVDLRVNDDDLFVVLCSNGLHKLVAIVPR